MPIDSPPEFDRSRDVTKSDHWERGYGDKVYDTSIVYDNKTFENADYQAEGRRDRSPGRLPQMDGSPDTGHHVTERMDRSPSRVTDRNRNSSPSRRMGDMPNGRMDHASSRLTEQEPNGRMDFVPNGRADHDPGRRMDFSPERRSPSRGLDASPDKRHHRPYSNSALDDGRGHSPDRRRAASYTPDARKMEDGGQDGYQRRFVSSRDQKHPRQASERVLKGMPRQSSYDGSAQRSRPRRSENGQRDRNGRETGRNGNGRNPFAPGDPNLQEFKGIPRANLSGRRTPPAPPYGPPLSGFGGEDQVYPPADY